MKISMIILFLFILLLCGILLRAASSAHKKFIIEKASQPVTKAEVQREIQLIPNAILF